MILHKYLYNRNFFLRSFIKKMIFLIKSTVFLFQDSGPSKEGLVPIPFLIREEETFRCNACGLCEEICPVQCIDVTAVNQNHPPFEREMESFSLAVKLCMSCSYCEQVCPEKAIVMRPPPKEYLFIKDKLDTQKLAKDLS